MTICKQSLRASVKRSPESIILNCFLKGTRMFIDSHAHLDTPNYDADRAEVIARARAAGVEIMLEIAGSDIGKGSLEPGLKLAEEHEFIYAAIGLHPHEASLYDTQLEQTLLEYSRHPKVI